MAKAKKHAGKKKGSLEETISYALFGSEPERFEVSYRDLDRIKTVRLIDFVHGPDYAEIPATRILQISMDSRVVWRKGQKVVTAKE